MAAVAPAPCTVDASTRPAPLQAGFLPTVSSCDNRRLTMLRCTICGSQSALNPLSEPPDLAGRIPPKLTPWFCSDAAPACPCHARHMGPDPDIYNVKLGFERLDAGGQGLRGLVHLGLLAHARRAGGRAGRPPARAAGAGAAGGGGGGAGGGGGWPRGGGGGGWPAPGGRR